MLRLLQYILMGFLPGFIGKMDLKNGNIELLGTVFGKDTTPEDTLKNAAIIVIYQPSPLRFWE